MSECKNCTDVFFKDLEFTEVIYDSGVKGGDLWHIYATVKNNSLIIGDTGRVCVFSDGNVLAKSTEFKLKAGESIKLNFSGVMPYNNLYVNLALNEIELFDTPMCADGYAVFIPLTSQSVPVNPSDPPIADSGPGDLWAQIMEFIEGSGGGIIIPLVLVIIIILLVRFK